MNSRPKDPRTARNKNVLIVGGSGSGKTRFWIKPNLLQMHSSYVVTDPKGSIVIECGNALLRYGYKLKIFNTINFKKSMHYNPFAYIHSEKDILKLVTTLIANTKGDGKEGDEFWTKAETLLYCALIGYIHFEAPIEEICKLAHEKGIIVVVDGAQSTPHIDIDVQKLDCDFFVFSAHKLCGPTGVGVMYGKKKWMDMLEPVFFGGESNARFNKCGDLILKESPLKFESGTQPIEGVIGMAAAMDYLQKIGKDNIHAHEVMLKEYFLEQVKDLDKVIIYNANAKSGICTFNIMDKGKMLFAQDVAGYLDSLGIAVRSGQHCAKLLPDILHTPGTCRASFYIYNTKEDVDKLVEGLKNATIENCVNIFF